MLREEMEIIIFTLIASYKAHRELERAATEPEGFRGRQHILTEQTRLAKMLGERILDQRNLQAEWRTVLSYGSEEMGKRA